VINGPILLSFDVISETELRGSKARNEKKVFPFPTDLGKIILKVI
jgi:hypothetical protein